jgi:nitrite reductase (NAD(P)H)
LHFPYSRADLYSIVAVKRLKTFESVMNGCGKDPNSLGCEICKPAVGSILASLFNQYVLDNNHNIQDTNDRFLANIQRNGSYSVIPRVPGGEITPDKLMAIAQVAKKYSLYCKITGGQRIDMFGARKDDLLTIWSELVSSGLESGHAYAKALRTVKVSFLIPITTSQAFLGHCSESSAELRWNNMVQVWSRRQCWNGHQT